MSSRSRAGMTIVDVVAVVACVPCLLALGAATRDGTRVSARAQLDATQVRGIHQGMVVFAQNNNDNYPIPSRLDRSNTTLPNEVVKDLPRNVASVLVFIGIISPEIMVSPAEVNQGIAANEAYEFSAPVLAVKPEQALWDPAFRAYPVDEDGPEKAGVSAGCSYAFVPFVGKRRQKWTNSFSATEPVVGWRGPAYDAAPGGGWALAPRAAAGRTGVGSNRLLFPGAGHGWSGNISFNDNHVELLTRPDPESLTFSFSKLPPGRRTVPDNLFVNENDQTREPEREDLTAGDNLNNFLATWTSGTVQRQGENQTLKDLAGGMWWD